LPDIDHPSSWVGQRLRQISRPLAATIGQPGRPPFRRGGARLHEDSALAGFHRAAIDPLVVGYLSHLAADVLTTSGVRLACRRVGPGDPALSDQLLRAV